jgi:hypothetical protein
MTTPRGERTAHHCDFNSLANSVVGPLWTPWWCAPSDGAVGQATAAGLWTKELSALLRGAMPSHHVAQLYTSHFWQSGVLAPSTHSCRATTAAAIVALTRRIYLRLIARVYND